MDGVIVHFSFDQLLIETFHSQPINYLTRFPYGLKIIDREVDICLWGSISPPQIGFFFISALKNDSFNDDFDVYV